MTPHAQTAPLFARPDFQAAAGAALRPGGTVLTERLVEAMALPSGAAVLDVGCGRGASLALLARSGFRPVGADPCTALLGQAETGMLLAASARALPLASGTFAGVLCECVLSLLDDKAAALAEMRRVLAPGGLLGLADLYLRPGGNNAPRTGACRPREIDAPAPRPAPGCATGAAPWPVIEALLGRAGFGVLCFTDHSRALTEMAADLLFAGFSPQTLGLGCAGAARTGYFACVAKAEAP